MKIKTTRQVTKTEEIELEFTQWDALALVSQNRYKKKYTDLFETTWNGLRAEVAEIDGVYRITLSDDYDLYKRFNVTFTFEEN